MKRIDYAMRAVGTALVLHEADTSLVLHEVDRSRPLHCGIVWVVQCGCGGEIHRTAAQITRALQAGRSLCCPDCQRLLQRRAGRVRARSVVAARLFRKVCERGNE